MKIRCRKCGKRFSGEANKVQAILSCPKCASAGEWWELAVDSISQLKGGQPEASGPALDVRPTVDETPMFQRMSAPPPMAGAEFLGWEEAKAQDADVLMLKKEVQRLSAVVESMRSRSRDQAYSQDFKPPATNKLVWSNDIVLLILLALLFFTVNSQKRDIQQLQTAVDALVRWSDQDFLVAP